jgi:hypothetical protein
MFKFLLISILVFYVVFRLGGFLFKLFLLPLFKTQGDSGSNGNSKKNGDIHIDYIPEDRKNKKSSQSGEYIDYEEIK